jgi:hypothetical protein
MVGMCGRAKLLTSWLGRKSEEEEGAGVPTSLQEHTPMTLRLPTRLYFYQLLI